MDEAKTYRVFVYGSLMGGMSNHDLLAEGGAEFLGAARTKMPRPMYDLGWFPAVVDRLGHDQVVGELYRVDGPTLERLDRLEGHPHAYRRELVGIEGQADAWMYLMDPRRIAGRAGLAPVRGGDWRAHWARIEAMHEAEPYVNPNRGVARIEGES
jgi:gamma-glutamylaminecyclotransferase